MKSKKIMASLLALSMSVTAFSGCGTAQNEEPAADSGNTSSADAGSDNTADTQTDAPEDTSVNFAEMYNDDNIQLTIYSQTANYSGKMTGWFGKILKDKFNCEVTIIPDSDGAFDTRMESGSLGDIVIFGSDGDEYKRAVEQGKLFDWNEDDILSEFGANIKENMPHALEKNMDINEAAGAGRVVYGFAHDVATSPDDHQSFMYTWDVRWDLYNELGKPEVKDLDDFVDLMIQMKQICPTDDNGNPTYAVSLWPDWDGNMVMYVKAFASAYYGYDELEMGLYDVETGDYHFALEENGPYLESLKFFNKLYQNNLVDPNSMTQTYDEMREKFTAGGAFFSIFNYAGSQLYNTDEHKAENKMMLTLTPDEATPIAYGMNVMGSNRVWTIGADTKYPELCMAIINYLTTPEGYMTYRFGPKELNWYYDEEGYTHFTEFGETCFTDSETKMPDEWGGGTFKDGCGYLAISNSTWSIDATNPETNGETYNPDKWVSRQKEASCDTEQAWRDFTGCVSVDQYLDGRSYKTAIGGASYSAGTRSDELEIIWEQVKNCIVTYTWQALYAKDDAEYDRLVSEMIAKCAEYDPDGQCEAWSKEQAEIRHNAELEAIS